MMAVAGYWVHDLDPVIVHLWGNLALRWYGLAYVAGFVVGVWLLRRDRLAGRSPLNAVQEESLLLWMIGGVLLGGRIGYVLLYDFAAFMRDPLLLFRVWDGGMASHGGFIGVTVAVLLFSWRNRVGALHVGDMIAGVAAPGLFFGRLANFINGELWGKVTDVRWAVIFPEAPFDANRFAVYSEALGRMANPRHPSQLYAAVLEGVVLFAIVRWRMLRLYSGGKVVHGLLVAEFWMAYAVLRIVGEQFREPDAALIMGTSRGVFYSLLLLVAGAVLRVALLRHNASRGGKFAG